MKHTADFDKKRHLKGKDLKLHSADNFKKQRHQTITPKTEADGIETGSEDMMTIGKHYLWVNVYRDNLGDCTGGGLTSRVNDPTLFFNCTREEAIEYCKENGINPENQLFLVERQLWGEDHFYAEPLVKPANAGRCNQMFGGNYIMTSDGRFPHQNGLKTAYPIPVHDRFEVCS